MNNPPYVVLVVDDNRDFLDAMISLLESDKKYEILYDSDGQEALAILQDRVPDLLITDISMPKMGGFELIEHTKQDNRFENMRIILLTADTTTEKMRRGKTLGVTEYIVKPFMPAEFLTMLHRLLG